MKILVIALSGIGDALMFTPAIELLKKHLPDSVIDALVMYRGSEEIYFTNSNLNKIIYFDFIHEGFAKSFRFLKSIRKSYDVSISVYPSNRKEYNIINYLIGAGKRAGVKYIRKNFFNFGFLNNIQVREDDLLHNVQTNIRLCETLLKKKFIEEPPLVYQLPNNDLSFAEKFLQNKGINEKDLVIGFHPGCSTVKNHAKRRWEPEKFAILAGMLIEKHSAKIILFGGPDERLLKEKIINLVSSDRVFAVDAGSLNQSSAVMNRCNVFVTNDSSQMHIASALRIKIVAILGPTNPNYIHPWKTEHEVVSLNLECAPCFFYSPRPLNCSRSDVKFKCIKEISVGQVYEAVMKFLV